MDRPATEGTREAALVARLRAAGCVFAEDEARLLLEAVAADPPGVRGPRLEELTARRVAGERLEDVLGWAEFCGQRFVVEPGVFVPRTRSGHLVDLAAALLHPGATLLDLCCGTGALGAATARRAPGVRVLASDVDATAVRCAVRNLPGHEVHHGDLFDALPPGVRGTVDVVLANVPYVPHREIAQMPAEAREHEDHRALDGGSDGLDVLRRVLAEVRDWLRPGGTLLSEVGAHQAEAAVTAASAAGLAARAVTSAEFEATALVAVAPGLQASSPPG